MAEITFQAVVLVTNLLVLWISLKGNWLYETVQSLNSIEVPQYKVPIICPLLYYSPSYVLILLQCPYAPPHIHTPMSSVPMYTYPYASMCGVPFLPYDPPFAPVILLLADPAGGASDAATLLVQIFGKNIAK